MTEETRPFRLIYRSRSRIAAEERPTELAQIFGVARSNNKEKGVTGALLVTDHWFVQALEGDEPTVRRLYEQIRDDERHDEVTVIESTEVDGPVFSRWSMAEVSKLGHADIPLHVTEGRIHPAAERPLTREQFAVLKTMRDTIGADSV